MTSSRRAWHITSLYVVAAVSWILFSDYLLQLAGLDALLHPNVQTAKGLLFVAVTGALLFFVTRRQLRRRRQQDKQIRLNEERFDLALNGSNDGVWDWDMEKDTLYFSSRGKNIIGFVPDNNNADLRIAWLQRVHPEDLPSIKQALRAHVRGDSERLDHTHRVLHRDGHYVWVHARGKATRDVNGRAQRVIGIVRDVTQQKLNEERLQQAAVVFDSTNEGVVVSDALNRIINVNKAFCRITGYSRDYVIGKSPGMLKSGWHDGDFYRQLWKELQRTGSWQGEIWNRRNNGEIYPQWQTINTVHDQDGKLTHYVAVFADISQIKRSQKEIDFLAHHDPLTRLPNRLLVVERLNNAIQRAKRSDEKVGLVSIDIDRFKTVNDSLGHSAGDELLRAAAERMAHLCREEDTLARLGGDEFVMLVEHLNRAEDLTPIAQRIQRAFARPYDIAGQKLHLSVSLGMSIYPDDGLTSGELLKNADTAISQAKNSGRNTYAFYTQALTDRARRQMALESDLHQAIKQQQLDVYYQPQKDLRSGLLVGMEALVRWHHPTLGLIAPDEFLPVAQHAGLMIAIDEFVLNQACQQMRTWLDSGHALTCMAVNMSGYWLERGQVLESVERALAQTGLPAQHLELEVTEGEVMQHGDQCIARLDALREMGVRIAIDDFGTGHSSLLRLKRLPVTKLKIDRGFVAGLPGDSNDSAIARAIIALGKSLQLSIIAEGVETAEQEALLKELDCDFGQGYLYSRPVPARVVEGLLR